MKTSSFLSGFFLIELSSAFLTSLIRSEAIERHAYGCIIGSGSSSRAGSAVLDSEDTTSAANKSNWSSLSFCGTSLRDTDPVLADLIDKEEHRQKDGLELIASENFASAAVREALGSCLTNKYSEGTVGRRYYGGNQYIDAIETLCMDRALALYQLNPNEWGVNVQPYSGSPANFAVYTALLQPHDRLMGLDLPSGGHLTHGFQTKKRKVSATSIYFESMPYVVNDQTGLIDYDDMERRATMFMPKLLIAGGSAYPREWNYERMRQIANKVGAYLMTDMAHLSGLVAAGCAQSPFAYSDVVTTTTHKTLRGPRSGMIFAKKEFMTSIDAAVFPALQGGPHNHQIAAVAVALKEAATPEFQRYARQVVSNAQTLAQSLIHKRHTIATGGTDNHLLLWDVRSLGLTGSKLEKVLEMASITTNKNSLPGDTSAIHPGAIRLGTPALTSRGLVNADFEIVAEFLHRGCDIALRAEQMVRDNPMNPTTNSTTSKVSLKDFIAVLDTSESLRNSLSILRKDVESFIQRFPIPGDVVRI